jgi:hypothetical protein
MFRVSLMKKTKIFIIKSRVELTSKINGVYCYAIQNISNSYEEG